MNVWLISPAWRRYGVTELALSERRWLCDTLASRGVEANAVIVADDDNLDIARSFGFDTVEYPNDRGLGARFNVAFRHAYEQGADYVIHVGSDDWVHPDFFDPLPLEETFGQIDFSELAGAGTMTRKAAPTVLTAARIGVVDLESGTGFVFNKRRPWGVIPWAIPRAVFDRDGTELCDPEFTRGIEGSMSSRWTVDYRAHDPHPFLAVDFKSDTNVTDYMRLWLLGLPQLPDVWAALAEHYPTRFVEQARSLHESLAVAA